MAAPARGLVSSYSDDEAETAAEEERKRKSELPRWLGWLGSGWVGTVLGDLGLGRVFGRGRTCSIGVMEPRTLSAGLND